MKFIVFTCLFLLMGLVSASLADKLYTWTDANGVTHITQTPPPANAKLRDIIPYEPRTQAEIRAIEQQRQAIQERFTREAALEDAREARRKAQEARQRAADARAAAEAAERRAEAFKERVSNNTRRRQLNLSTILRLEAEALAARNKAVKALEDAELAEKRAEEVEKRAEEIRESDAVVGSETLTTPESTAGQTSP